MTVTAPVSPEVAAPGRAPARPSLDRHEPGGTGCGACGHRRAGGPGAHAHGPALALALCARGDRLRRDDQRLEGPPGAPRRRLCRQPAGDRHRADLRGRHAQVALALSAARRRTSGGGGDGLYPRGRARHAVPLQPGRLHALLHLLPHRHADAGAQPDGRGDRRPGAAGARPAGRLSGAGRVEIRSGARARRQQGSALDRPAGLQHRHDGHGRAAL